jgi:hypothetical protein
VAVSALRDLSTRRLKRRYLKYTRLWWRYDFTPYRENAQTVRSLLAERKVYVP